MMLVQRISAIFGGSDPVSTPGGMVAAPSGSMQTGVIPAAAPTAPGRSGSRGGTTRGGGMAPMMMSLDPVGGGGGWFGDLVGGITDLVGAAAPIAMPLVARALQPQPQERGFFDIPGIDLRSPVQTEATTAMQASTSALVTPFHATLAGRAVPNVHVRANPVTGKAQWFHPAKPTGWKMTHKAGTRRRGCSCRKTSTRRCRKR